jgi:hypothetical protein
MSTQRELAALAESPSALTQPSRIFLARARCDSFRRVLCAFGWSAVGATGWAPADEPACSARRVAIAAMGRSFAERAFLADFWKGGRR